MSKQKYSINPEPLTKTLVEYIAKHTAKFDKDKIDELPNPIKNKIAVSKSEQNNIFINKAFSDVETFYNKLPYSKKEFNINKDDKIYFMYKLRDNPDLLVNSGYTKYLFNLVITNDSGNVYDDQLYTLTITETETGQIGVYSTMVGRFD